MPKTMEWRKNLLEVIERFWGSVPQTIVDCIDAAYVAGLDDGEEEK